MNQNIITGILFGTGAIVYDTWTFYDIWASAKEQGDSLSWSPFIMAKYAVPSIALGFVAGYQLPGESTAGFLTELIAGFGLAAGQSKITAVVFKKK